MEINEPSKNKKQQKIIMKNIMNSFPFMFVLLKTRRKENERTIFFSTKRKRKKSGKQAKQQQQQQRNRKKKFVQIFNAIHLWF